MSDPFQRRVGPVVEINIKLFGAVLLSAGAWLLWPNSPQWWGMGLISILLGAGAFVSLVRALRMMAQLYVRDRAIAAYLQQGSGPKSSRIATTERLRDAGMIDD